MNSSSADMTYYKVVATIATLYVIIGIYGLINSGWTPIVVGLLAGALLTAPTLVILEWRGRRRR